jgi:hypothetical protein
LAKIPEVVQMTRRNHQANDAVNTASNITRGFMSEAKSARRAVEAGREGNCSCDKGIVALIVNSSAPEICFREVDNLVGACARLFSRIDVVQSRA